MSQPIAGVGGVFKAVLRLFGAVDGPAAGAATPRPVPRPSPTVIYVDFPHQIPTIVPPNTTYIIRNWTGRVPLPLRGNPNPPGMPPIE